MQIAVAGKGGSGKTTVSGTLARLFARRGYDVLAVDDDDDPDLAVSLGVPHGADVPTLPGDLVERVETDDGETSFELTRPPAEVFEEYAFDAPGDVTLLESCSVSADNGSIGAGHIGVSLGLSEYEEEPGEVVVLDMAAHVDYLGVANHVDALVLVGQPYYTSLETVRKMYVVARGVGISDIYIVANNVRPDGDRELFEEYCSDRSLEVSAVVPHDEAVQAAEREGAAPMDYDDSSPAVRAIGEIADDLLAAHAPRPDPGETIH